MLPGARKKRANHGLTLDGSRETSLRQLQTWTCMPRTQEKPTKQLRRSKPQGIFAEFVTDQATFTPAEKVQEPISMTVEARFAIPTSRNPTKPFGSLIIRPNSESIAGLYRAIYIDQEALQEIRHSERSACRAPFAGPLDAICASPVPWAPSPKP